MSRLRVAVLFGGASKDNIVSCRSAYYVINEIEHAKIEVLPIGITRAGRWLYFPGNKEEILNGEWEQNPDCCSAVLSPDPHHGGIIKILPDGHTSIARIDAIFPVLHGKYGECGQIQSLCKLTGVPFVGSEYDAANACTDKMLTYLILNKAGVKTANYMYLERNLSISVEDNISEILSDFSYPLFIKPACCSSSIGVNFANNQSELIAAIKVAFSHHHKVIIEENLIGRELECAVFGNDYSLDITNVLEIVPDEKFPHSEYIKGVSKLVSPLLCKEIINQILESSIIAFRALGCKIYAKISYKLIGNQLYCTNVSNVPGMTQNSSFVHLMPDDKSGFFADLIKLSIESRN